MKHQELIEKYFEGNLSDQDAKALEEMVQAEPAVKSDFEFQKDVVDGLKSSRKMELKARLNAIEIPPTPFYSTLAGKLTFGFAGLIAISGLFFVMSLSSDTVSKNGVSENLESNDTDQLAVSADTTKLKDVASEEVTEVPTTIALNTTPEKAEESTVDKKANKTVRNKATEDKAKDTTKKEVKIQPVQPTIASNFDEENIKIEQGESALAIETFESSLKENSSLDINNITDKKKYQFHYQVKEGQLVLYGTFDKGIYEIYEINSGNAKKIFLYYNKNYYRILMNQRKVLPLEQLEKSELNEIIEALN